MYTDYIRESVIVNNQETKLATMTFHAEKWGCILLDKIFSIRGSIGQNSDKTKKSFPYQKKLQGVFLWIRVDQTENRVPDKADVFSKTNTSYKWNGNTK